MTLQDIDDELEMLSAKLHDGREGRDAKGEVIYNGVLMERMGMKLRRKELRRMRDQLLLEVEAQTVPRNREEIELEIQELSNQKRELRQQISKLNRERDRRLMIEKFENMSAQEKATLKTLFGA